VRILIVDDHKVVRDGIRFMLTDEPGIEIMGEAGAAVVVGLVAVVFLSQPELRGVPDGTETVAVGDRQHVVGEIHDDGEVPAGGAHSEIWQNCGFYDQEIDSENAVHSLEHGAVWISYDPSLSGADIAALRSFVSRSEKVLVSPVPGQDSPIIVTAWATQLQLRESAR
jgi:CheY-like chemotaxis protein